MLESLFLKLKAERIDIKVKDDNLVVNFPKDYDSTDLMKEIRTHKEAIISFLTNNVTGAGKVDNMISVAPFKKYYKVSSAQKRIYLAHELDKDSLAYNMPKFFELEGVLDRNRLIGAFQGLLDRHEGLRTRFTFKEDGAVQFISSDIVLEPEFFTASGEDEVASIVDGFVRPFDLGKDLLFRFGLIERDSKSHILMLDMHHIVTDGVSQGILLEDFRALYEGNDLSELSLQYKDYSEWQNNDLEQEKKLVQREFWLKKFKEEVTDISLPYDGSLRSEKVSKGGVLSHSLSVDRTRGLKAYANQEGTTLFMVLFSVYNILLSKLGNQEDVVVGIPSAGRTHDDLGGIVGMFANTLPLRNYPKGELSFKEFLKEVTLQTLSCFDNQSYQFNDLVDDLDVVREVNRNPLFNVMFTFQNFALSALELPGILVRPYERSKSASLFDMILKAHDDGGMIYLNFEYDADLFQHSTIERFAQYYDKIISGILENPTIKLSEIGLISAEEEEALVYTMNSTAVDYPRDSSIVELFSEQVSLVPNNVALVFGERELTYRELDVLSNQFASYLVGSHGVVQGDLVGLMLDRSEWLIISILGILKSGAAYVPIDRDYPVDRISFMKEDTGCRLCIDQGEIGLFLSDRDGYDIDFDAARRDPESLAYVMYTSGSTGVPKGVEIMDRGVVRLVKSCNYVDFTDRDKLLSTGSISFDATTFEYWGMLLNGGCLILCGREALLDSSVLADNIEGHSVTKMWFTSGWFNQLVETDISMFSGLKTLMVGGDKLSPDHINRVLGRYPDLQIVNGYGPTENTTFSLTHAINRTDGGSDIPIGRPINNSTVYILDAYDRLVPQGVMGEICLGGDGLAKGYLNDPGLTGAKFIEDPFKKGERLYRTGDLGRWSSEGEIEFLGRKDDQVKIRGHRIELGEIEGELSKKEDIMDVLVLARDLDNGQKDLVAYMVCEEEQDLGELRNFLSDRLPEYMLPSYYVQLGEFPLNSNGKVDRKALPSPDTSSVSGGSSYEAPRTLEERLLVAVWEEVLKRDGIGINASFYNYGGDSIKSIQVVSRLKQHGYSLKVSDILGTPVLRNQAGLVVKSDRKVDQSPVVGDVALTPIQRMFFEDRTIKAPHHYNQSVLLRSGEALDFDILDRCLDDLVRHHDALRMSYGKEDGHWKQYNSDIDINRYTFDFHDLRESVDPLSEMERLGSALQCGFDLGNGPLFKACLFRLEDGDRLALIAHHLVIDGISWRIVMEDLSSLYNAYSEGHDFKLPAKTDSFQRWALLQKEYVENGGLSGERTYWEGIVNDALPAFPTDNIVEGEGFRLDSRLSFTMDRSTTELLQTRVHNAYGTEINDILLTGLGLAIRETFDLDKSMIKMEGHGREDIMEDIDVGRTLGWFTSVYPFILSTGGGKDRIGNLIGIKESLRKVPNKGVGYGMLKYLDKGFDKDLSPSMVFNYLGDFGSRAGDESVSSFEYASESIGSDMSIENSSDTAMSISGMLSSDRLTLSLDYSATVYEKDTMERFAASYRSNLEFLIKELSGIETRHLTPSDLTFKGLSVSELSDIDLDGNVEDIYKLSPLQEGMYFHWLSNDSTSLYFEQLSYGLRASDLNISDLKSAYDRLVMRHSILRTGFTNDYGGRPLQVVGKSVPSGFSYHKAPERSGVGEKERYVSSFKQKDKEEGFDLSGPSQMRLSVLDLGKGDYEFIWSFHHILMDGWCLSILINDFYRLFEDAGSTKALAPAMPYSNYIKWLEKLNTEESLDYWETALDGYSNVATIPFNKKVITDKVYVGEKKELSIKGELLNKVNQFCNTLGITQNIFMQGVWGYLLSKYNNTDDVVFGTVVSGRPGELQDVENMVGLFINTIPVRVAYDNGDTPKTLLRKIQDQAISGNAHHYLNLSEIQSRTELGKELIDHILVFENYAVQDTIKQDTEGKQQTMEVTSVEVYEETNYDFNILIIPSKNSLAIEFRYNTVVYQEEKIKYLVNHFTNLVEQFSSNAEISLETLAYLTAEEEEALVYTMNSTAADYPRDSSIVELFSEQVSLVPNNVALVFGERELTYRELDVLSNQFASYLVGSHGVVQGDLVGLMLDRSEWLIISILGILKSGAAYVPIDRDYPVDRISFMKEDTGCRLCIDQGRSGCSCPIVTDTTLILMLPGAIWNPWPM